MLNICLLGTGGLHPLLIILQLSSSLTSPCRKVTS